MDDKLKHELLERYAALGRFGHREHLHMAWSFVRRDGVERAQDAVVDFIRHVAESHGDTEKFNETITRFWVRAVAYGLVMSGGADFERFLEDQPHLLESGLPFRHWSRELLLSPAARARWVEPDVLALPL